MNDECPPTKSAADEGDHDEALEEGQDGTAQSHKLYESTAQEENEKQSAPSDTMSHAPQLVPAIVPVPIQPYYPPYPYYMPSSDAVYIDQSLNLDPPPDRRNRGGVTEPFPEKLHRMLDTCEREGLVDVVGFFSHGRAFSIHKPRKFTTEIMPRFFRQTRFTSFQRQLNLYGFKRISQGPDHGGYWHEFFLRGRPGLCRSMKRVKVKGSNLHKKDFEGEPNFYSMPPVMASIFPPPGGIVALPPEQPAGGPPMQGSPPAPFGYATQPGYGFPMVQQPSPFTMAQMPSGEAAVLPPGYSPPQQEQQQPPPQQQAMYPYPPPFYGYPPPWMQPQPPPPPGTSLPSSPAQPSSAPAGATAEGGEDTSPGKAVQQV